MQSRLDPERWRRQKAAFQEALDMDAGAREAFVARLRGEDAALADAVAAMLAVHEADDGALDEPAIAARPSADPVIGLDVDGKYRIEQSLGRGGMGSVYRATHLWTGRAVAVKIIAPEFVRLPEFVERFKREARAAGRLRHPNVVNVTDFGFSKVGEGRLAYLVMEYLDGRSLGDLLAERGPLPLGFAVEVIEQICLAVDAAHASGVLHRDLKPDNIWLEPDGRGGFTVKVLDFGIARLRDAGGDTPEPRPMRAAREATRPTRRLPWAAKGTLAVPATPEDAAPLREPTAVAVDARTVVPGRSRASMVLGTPAYMSPEQCRGDGADERSDVYGLGIVAYEMLAGKTPFSGDLESLLVKHGEMPPPPLRAVRRDLPRPVEAVVRNALAKSPGERPPTAGAFAAAFAAAARGERFLEREAAARLAQHRVALWRLRLRARALFVALAALAVVGLSTTWLPAEPPAAVVALCWLVPFALLVLASDFGAAACAIALERPPSGAAGELEIEDHSTRLWRRAHLVAAAAARGWARPAGVFAALVAAAEHVSLAAAVARSRALVTTPGSFASRVFLRRLVTALGLLLFMVACSTTAATVVGALAPSVSVPLVAYFVAACVGLAGGAVLSSAEIARAALYLSARRASGESVGAARTSADFVPPDERRRSSGRVRTPALVAAGLVGVLLLGAIQFLVVPPLAPLPRPTPPVVKAVPDADNAWVEYKLALAIFQTDDARALSEETRAALRDYARGAIRILPAEARAIIDHNLGALDHVVLGARRPFAQYTADPIDGDTPLPSWRGLVGLSFVAGARARELADAGQIHEATTLFRSAYRLAADLGDRSAPPICYNFSTYCRRLLSGTAAAWAANLPTIDHAALARSMADLDRRVATPVQLLESGRVLAASYGASMLLDNSAIYFFLDRGTLAFLPGLRARAYRDFLARRAAIEAAERRAAETWDSPAAFEAFSGYSSFRIDSAEYLRPDRLLAKQAASYSSGIDGHTDIRDCYVTSTQLAATRAFLVCAAYRERHGVFPTTLDAACAEADLDVPLDVATGTPIGYRLDDDVPVVWLPGLDHVDDGGRDGGLDEGDSLGRPTVGYDVVYRFGKQHDQERLT